MQGIGRPIAQELAAADAHIAVHGLADAKSANAACEELRAAEAAGARYFEAIMRDVSAIEAITAALADRGVPDVFVNLRMNGQR